MNQALAHEALGQTEDQIISQPADAQNQDVVTVESEQDSSGETQGVGSRIKSRFQEQKEKLQQRQQQVRQNLQEKRDELKAQAQERRAQLQEKKQELKRNKLHERQAKRVLAFSKRMLDRFEAAVKRQDHLAARILARLDKMAAKGKDVASYRTMLDAAKAKIDAARLRLQEARGSLDMIAPSEDPRAQFEDARAKLHAVKEEIKTAHAALVEVIHSIKGASSR